MPLLKPLNKELDRILEMGVIKKIEKSTECCHPRVKEIKPNGKIRMCIDLTKLNAITKRELYQIDSTIEKLARAGKNCKV